MTSSSNSSDDTLLLQGTFGSRKRTGAWVVPPTITIRTRMGSTELDFTQADFRHDDLLITVEMTGGSIELRVPEGAGVDTDGVATRLASVEDHRGTASTQGSPKITITGKLTWGSLEIRGPRK